MLKTLKNQEQIDAISPLAEAAAYEALWDQDGMWFKKLAEFFDEHRGERPSSLVPAETVAAYESAVLEALSSISLSRVGVLVRGMSEYPEKLTDAEHPVEVLYYEGSWDLVESRCVSVVGTRNPTEEGTRRTEKLVRALVDDEFVIVSGLAKGVDTAAHRTAIDAGGSTIAVLGTPLTQSYPKDNKELHRRIATDHLVVSQVPFIRYKQQFYKQNRYFFPERNKTMSALSEATIIVEAGESSGTLVQARAAIHQGRKLFILDSCFEAYDWPYRMEKKGAIRVKEYEEIRGYLGVESKKGR